MSQLRAKVKFKHRGDWTPFHNQPWFLATPSCSSTNKLYSLVHSHLWGCSALYHSFHQPWCAQYKLKNSECRGPICGRLSYTIRKWVPVSGGRSNRDTPYPLGIETLAWRVADLWLVTESTINCGDCIPSSLPVLHLYWALCQINLEVVVPLWSRPWTKFVSFVKRLFWLVLLLVHKLTSHLLT